MRTATFGPTYDAKLDGTRLMPPIPSMAKGYCQCGCGQKTRICTSTDRGIGHIKGQPIRFVLGHGSRGRSFPKFDPDTAYVIKADSCWIWQRAKDNMGYGVFERKENRHKAHRYFWEKKHGPIPKGLELDHLCRVPSCVNPDHLEPVTHAENCRRGKRARLTSERVGYIRKRVEQGFSHSAVAREMGLHHSTVNGIIRGKRWVGVRASAVQREMFG